MAATTTSPVKILLDLGYEIWEMEKDGYRSALMESINDLTRINPRDGRIAILIQALKNLKRAPDKPKINISKVLNKRITGADIKPADVDDSSTSSALVPDRLSNVADSLDSIALLLRRQLGLEKKQQRDDRKKQDKDNKDAREDKLEGKPKDKKTGLIPNAIKKPALNFFEKLKTFFLNIAIGSAVYKMLDWLKDPANAEKIAKFSEFLINNAPLIIGGLAALALLPIALTLVNVVSGIISGLSLLGPLLPALPWILGGILVGAVAWWIGKKIKKAIVGGEDFSKARDDNLKRLEAQGITKSGRVLDPDTEKEIYVKRWEGSTGASGDDKYGSIEGRPWGPGDKGRNDSVKINLNDAESQDWYGKFYGQEKLEEKLAALNLYKKTKADIVKKKDEMHDKLRETVHVGGSIEKKRESMDNPEWAEIMSIKDLKERKKRIKVFRKETDRLVKIERNKIEENYGQEALNIQKNSSSATIDKNLKKETNISPPNTKGKGSTTIIDGGGGQQQSVGGGGGGINGTTPPSFPSQDPNNLGTFSTQGMYNMVG